LLVAVVWAKYTEARHEAETRGGRTPDAPIARQPAEVSTCSGTNFPVLLADGPASSHSQIGYGALDDSRRGLRLAPTKRRACQKQK